MPLKYYPRAVKLKFKKEFITPFRAVVDTEYNKKADFPNQIKLEDYVSIKVKYFSAEDISSFLRENGAMKKLNDDIQYFMKGATDSYLSMLSLRPLYNRPWPQLNQEQFNRFMRFLNIAEGNITTRSLPVIPISMEYKDIVEQFCKQYIEFNPIIWLNLDEDSAAFEKRIDILKPFIKDGNLQMLGFFAGYNHTALDYNVNLDYIYSNFKDSNVILIYEGSYKSFSKTIIGTSKIHYHPFEVFDVISPYRFPPGGGGDSKKTKKREKTLLERINETPFLDKENISLTGFTNIGNERIKKYLDQKSKTFIDNISYKIENPDLIVKDDLKSFKSFADVQQIVAGEEAMAGISNSIQKHETFDYIKEKENLQAEVKTRLSKL